MDEETRKEFDKLAGVMEDVGMRQVSQEDRIANLEKRAAAPLRGSLEGDEEEPEKKVPSIDSSEKEGQLRVIQGEVAELRSKLETYESPAYSEELIRRWARGLTPESYIALGVKLGYQNVLAQETIADPEGFLGEVALEDGLRVIFSEVIPEGETGWEKSERLGCFTKVVTG